MREELNGGNINRLGDLANAVDLGDLLAFLVQKAAATETGITPSSDVATLAAPAKKVFHLNATAGTFTGILDLKIGDSTVSPSSGEAVWAGPGNDEIRLNSADAITALSAWYSRTDEANVEMTLTSRRLGQHDTA